MEFLSSVTNAKMAFLFQIILNVKGLQPKKQKHNETYNLRVAIKWVTILQHKQCYKLITHFS